MALDFAERHVAAAFTLGDQTFDFFEVGGSSPLRSAPLWRLVQLHMHPQMHLSVKVDRLGRASIP